MIQIISKMLTKLVNLPKKYRLLPKRYIIYQKSAIFNSNSNKKWNKMAEYDNLEEAFDCFDYFRSLHGNAFSFKVYDYYLKNDKYLHIACIKIK